jgi:hypothetical protein
VTMPRASSTEAAEEIRKNRHHVHQKSLTVKWRLSVAYTHIHT